MAARTGFDATDSMEAPPDYDEMPPPPPDVGDYEDFPPPEEALQSGLVYQPQNPIRRLLGLIALKPGLAGQLEGEHKTSEPDPALALLDALREQVAEQPDLSTAALLGYWYGTPEGEFLAELAGREVLEDDAGLEALAKALWDKLHTGREQVTLRAELAELKARDYASLSGDEKRRLLELTGAMRRLSGKN
jgi:DNA primase